jgi:hypothetical protein
MLLPLLLAEGGWLGWFCLLFLVGCLAFDTGFGMRTCFSSWSGCPSSPPSLSSESLDVVSTVSCTFSLSSSPNVTFPKNCVQCRMWSIHRSMHNASTRLLVPTLFNMSWVTSSSLASLSFGGNLLVLTVLDVNVAGRRLVHDRLLHYLSCSNRQCLPRGFLGWQLVGLRTLGVRWCVVCSQWQTSGAVPISFTYPRVCEILWQYHSVPFKLCFLNLRTQLLHVPMHTLKLLSKQTNQDADEHVVTMCIHIDNTLFDSSPIWLPRAARTLCLWRNACNTMKNLMLVHKLKVQAAYTEQGSPWADSSPIWRISQLP